MALADSCLYHGMSAMTGATPEGVANGQVSPDKNVNCYYATAAFTVSPESWALSCCADLPGGSALYAVSVRRLIALHAGFFGRFLTVSAVAIASTLLMSAH